MIHGPPERGKGRERHAFCRRGACRLTFARLSSEAQPRLSFRKNSHTIVPKAVMNNPKATIQNIATIESSPVSSGARLPDVRGWTCTAQRFLAPEYREMAV
jgi:hypothetical protein